MRKLTQRSIGKAPPFQKGNSPTKIKIFRPGGGIGVKSEPVLSEQPADESDANSLNEEKANPDDEATSAVLDENAKSEEPSLDGENLAEQGKDLESSEESDALDKKDATLEVSEEKEAQSVASDDPETKGIYLNGESGDDNNDG